MSEGQLSTSATIDPGGQEWWRLKVWLEEVEDGELGSINRKKTSKDMVGGDDDKK